MHEHRDKILNPRPRQRLQGLLNEAVDGLARKDAAKLVDELLDTAVEVRLRHGIEREGLRHWIRHGRIVAECAGWWVAAVCRTRDEAVNEGLVQVPTLRSTDEGLMNVRCRRAPRPRLCQASMCDDVGDAVAREPSGQRVARPHHPSGHSSMTSRQQPDTASDAALLSASCWSSSLAFGPLPTQIEKR